MQPGSGVPTTSASTSPAAASYRRNSRSTPKAATESMFVWSTTTADGTGTLGMSGPGRWSKAGESSRRGTVSARRRPLAQHRRVLDLGNFGLAEPFQLVFHPREQSRKNGRLPQLLLYEFCRLQVLGDSARSREHDLGNIPLGPRLLVRCLLGDASTCCPSAVAPATALSTRSGVAGGESVFRNSR